MTASRCIQRHRTAIGRTDLSRPMRMAVDNGIIDGKVSVFDYGCGRRQDVQRLREAGFAARGWDPVHWPHGQRTESDVVNLGYVVNVIENAREREQALRFAWQLASRVLIVGARLSIDRKSDAAEEFADGCRTRRNTFQKYYRQSELRDWIDATLGVNSVAAAPGVFFVFRDEDMRQSYLETRYRRQRAAPRIRKSDRLFEEHRTILEPLMAFVSDRGRLPVNWELAEHGSIEKEFGSVAKAFSVVRRVTGRDQWDRLRLERYEELQIHFALQRFRGRPRFSELSPAMQLDVRELFATYKNACESADRMLFRAGELDRIREAIRGSPVGKSPGTSLYVHIDALHLLPPLLRVYEGCARAYIGDVEGANLVKLSCKMPQVSYLSYPDFDSDPHPTLAASLTVRLQSLEVQYRDYSKSENPPILHRKESFLASDDPRREKFERLSQQEDRWGLYVETSVIGTQLGWEAVLKRRGVTLRGHRLVRRKSTSAG